MKQGENIKINATVLRVEGDRLDAQTPNGQLIQTHISNVDDKSVKTAAEDKAVKCAPENKSVNK